MTTLYKFKSYFTEGGLGAAPDPAPVATVVNTDANTKLADRQATTALSNLVGYYEYEYSGADDLDLVCLFSTTDTGTDQQNLVSYVVDKVYKIDAILEDTGTTIPGTITTIDNEIAVIDGIVDDILVDTGTTLDTKLNTIDNFLDTEIAAIKAKTDLITTGTTLTLATAVSGSTITAHRGDTLSAALENIGALTNYSKLWFTVKRDYDDADTAAVIQIEKTGGLLYLNGAVGTAGNGSLTINDEATGDVTIVLNASETAKLSPGNYQYDIQILRSAGTPVSTLTYGEFVVAADVTKATA